MVTETAIPRCRALTFVLACSLHLKVWGELPPSPSLSCAYTHTVCVRGTDPSSWRKEVEKGCMGVVLFPHERGGRGA